MVFTEQPCNKVKLKELSILTCTLFLRLLQAREISVPTSSRSAFPCALKKIVFPRAHVPKTPGNWERESSMLVSMNTITVQEFSEKCILCTGTCKKGNKRGHRIASLRYPMLGEGVAKNKN